MAYHNAAMSLLTSFLDGSDIRKISHAVLPNRSAQTLGWSSDGVWLFFSEGKVCAGLCSTHLWAARGDGSEVRLVFDNSVDSTTIAFHPSSSRFVFGCGLEAGKQFSLNKQLCQSEAGIFEVRPTGIIGVSPAYSPDGSRLAWLYYTRDISSQQVLLMVQDLAQDEPVELAQFKTNTTDRFLWLADNQTLVYVQRKDGVCDIFAASLGGGDPLLLHKLEDCYGWPILHEASPVGRYVVYYYQNMPYILDAGIAERPVLARGLVNARMIWTPDGQLIAIKAGRLPRLVDPATGLSTELGEDLPYYRLSLWLPHFYPFFNAVDWRVISLQP